MSRCELRFKTVWSHSFPKHFTNASFGQFAQSRPARSSTFNGKKRAPISVWVIESSIPIVLGNVLFIYISPAISTQTYTHTHARGDLVIQSILYSLSTHHLGVSQSATPSLNSSIHPSISSVFPFSFLLFPRQRLSRSDNSVAAVRGLLLQQRTGGIAPRERAGEMGGWMDGWMDDAPPVPSLRI